MVQKLGPWPYLLRGLYGLAFACCFVNSSTQVVDAVAPARRGSCLGLFGISTLHHLRLAQFGLGLLVSIVGLHGIFLVAALRAIAAIVPILRATAIPQ
jgi:hypothetical protein